jgi:hypothetical protein
MGSKTEPNQSANFSSYWLQKYLNLAAGELWSSGITCVISFKVVEGLRKTYQPKLGLLVQTVNFFSTR